MREQKWPLNNYEVLAQSGPSLGVCSEENVFQHIIINENRAFRKRQMRLPQKLYADLAWRYAAN